MPDTPTSATDGPTRTAKVRNLTGEARELPAAGRVIQPGEVVTLPADLAERLAEQPGWDLVTTRKPTTPSKPTDKREE